MARTNWKGSVPYEHIIGKETGEKVYALMELLGVQKKYEALQFAVDFAHHELVERPYKPSAEPERKTGHWIYDTERVAGDGWTYSQYHCSECGFQELGGLANFCPHCGAEMTR